MALKGWPRPWSVRPDRASETLVWNARPKRGDTRALQVEPSPELLQDFLSLGWEPVDPAEVARFARRWGPLHYDPTVDSEHDRYPIIKGKDPIRHYSTTARAFALILRVKNAVDANDKPNDADWHALAALATGQSDHDLPQILKGHMDMMLLQRRDMEADTHWEFANCTITRARAAIAYVVNSLVGAVGVSPYLVTANTGFPPWELQLGGASVLSALATQLLQTIVAKEGLYTCEACGTPHGRRAAPRRGEQIYCNGCSASAPQRAAKVRYQERRQLVRDLHAQGLSPEEIAERLPRKRASAGSAAQVKKWLAADGLG